jgi:hypothetical protein
LSPGNRSGVCVGIAAELATGRWPDEASARNCWVACGGVWLNGFFTGA